MSKILPKVYFGLHMLPGCAEYREHGHEPYRIFINEETIKKMDGSFQGRPVYVQHVDAVDMENLQNEADGYVVRSFFNPNDGKHWAEFIIVSDSGHEAIRNGWRLSNAYIPKSFAQGGLWNGIEFQKEIISGEYEHLAIVPNPRYDESVILTTEQFKEYNAKKEIELKRLANSKEKKVSLLKFFKKEKIENSADLESMSVILPQSKKEVTVTEAMEIADKMINMHGYAADEHMVKVNDKEEMSVKDLRDSYCNMKAAEEDMKKKNAEDEMKKKENVDLDGGQKDGEKDKGAADKTENADLDSGEKQGMKDKGAADKTENSEEDEEKKKENEDVADADKGLEKKAMNEDEKMKKNHFDALKNAHLLASKDPVTVNLDRAERGKQRYGSGK